MNLIENWKYSKQKLFQTILQLQIFKFDYVFAYLLNYTFKCECSL